MESRRLFIKSSMAILGSAMIAGKTFGKHLNQTTMQERPSPIEPHVVQEFVANAHGNFKKVQELLDKYPGLLNASWDWGGGDFETAMNAAGHTGQVEIAEFLLSRGARMDIFCAAMLGKLEILKSVLDVYPDLKTSKGPHGLKLLHHAQQGKTNAETVLKYLIEIGAS